jgi:hypothetical protein
MKNLKTFSEFILESTEINENVNKETGVTFGLSKNHEDFKQMPKLWDIIGVKNDGDKVNVNLGPAQDSDGEEFWNSLLTSNAKLTYKGKAGFYPYEFYVTPDKKMFYMTSGKGNYFKSVFMSKDTWDKEVESKIGAYKVY